MSLMSVTTNRHIIDGVDRHGKQLKTGPGSVEGNDG